MLVSILAHKTSDWVLQFLSAIRPYRFVSLQAPGINFVVLQQDFDREAHMIAISKAVDAKFEKEMKKCFPGRPV